MLGRQVKKSNEIEAAQARARWRPVAWLRSWWSSGTESLLPIIFSETAPLDLRIVGRMLFHAALVGIGAGLVGAAFFGSLEFVQRFLLEGLAGYVPLRAHGETLGG